jgi:hypothetical protein
MTRAKKILEKVSKESIELAKHLQKGDLTSKRSLKAQAAYGAKNKEAIRRALEKNKK